MGCAAFYALTSAHGQAKQFFSSIDYEDRSPMGLLDIFSSKKRYSDVAAKLYVAGVDQARSPGFFLEMGVPDSVDGRFDLIILHTMLLIRRLRANGADAAAVCQALLNLMFADMDRNLREMGVGDLSVGKQVKKMAKAFYGRSETWEIGLDDDVTSLAKAFEQTVYRSVAPETAKADGLAAYTLEADAGLKAQSLEGLLDGVVSFIPVSLKQAPVSQPAA